MISPLKETFSELIHVEGPIFIQIKIIHSVSLHKTLTREVLVYSSILIIDLKDSYLFICKLKKMGDKINVACLEIFLNKCQSNLIS